MNLSILYENVLIILEIRLVYFNFVKSIVQKTSQDKAGIHVALVFNIINFTKLKLKYLLI